MLASYRQTMTVRDQVNIAGVPWPVYKLLALAVATASAAPAVLAAAAAGTVVWLGLGAFQSTG